MNECLTTPQHKKPQIGYWVSEKGTSKTTVKATVRITITVISLPTEKKKIVITTPIATTVIIIEKEIFFNLSTHSTHFIYGYMASDIWLRTILIVRKETRCRHIGYSYRLTARVLLYAPSHRQDNTYHGLCYTSRGALAGTRNSSMKPHEGSIRRPTAP